MAYKKFLTFPGLSGFRDSYELWAQTELMPDTNAINLLDWAFFLTFSLVFENNKLIVFSYETIPAC